jgi:hypothetical protein
MYNGVECIKEGEAEARDRSHALARVNRHRRDCRCTSNGNTEIHLRTTRSSQGARRN